ncbi:TPA: GTPase Era [Candidatus Sumerlaeota bacterium]|nr:GTPase Era [Candidatus Sumerlaeota bacterium]
MTEILPVPPPFRSGFCALLGEPNVGKSTLANALTQFKVAIISSKPQTTRNAIKAIYNDDDSQIVFVDTPGVMVPEDRLNECLVTNALDSLEGADVVCHLVEAAKPRPLPPTGAAALDRVKKPMLLVVNKSDLLPGFMDGASDEDLRKRFHPPFPLERYRDIVFISAANNIGVGKLLDKVKALMPLGEPMYDREQLTDRDMRFLVSEVVREKVLENAEQEIPYAVAAVTETFQENPGRKHLIRVVLFVEQESQKAILIGRNGEKLHKIGAESRPAIEEICDHPVFLELWVKVRKNWRKKDESLREFGYGVTKKKPRKRRR